MIKNNNEWVFKMTKITSKNNLFVWSMFLGCVENSGAVITVHHLFTFACFRCICMRLFGSFLKLHKIHWTFNFISTVIIIYYYHYLLLLLFISGKSLKMQAISKENYFFIFIIMLFGFILFFHIYIYIL